MQQKAAVCMLNHPSQLKSLLSGCKLPDSDLLLTSNPDPDKPLTTASRSGFFPSLYCYKLSKVSLLSCLTLLLQSGKHEAGTVMEHLSFALLIKQLQIRSPLLLSQIKSIHYAGVWAAVIRFFLNEQLENASRECPRETEEAYLNIMILRQAR